MLQIVVRSDEEGQRLDKFLNKYLDNAPMSFIYKMLRKKNIKYNNSKAKGSELIKNGDLINLYFSDESLNKLMGDKTQKSNSSINLNIIYEDDNILLVNKKAGILSQKAEKNDESLNDAVKKYLCENLSEDCLRSFKPSISNRLDRNTSGIVIIGKNTRSTVIINEMLRNGTINKEYLALLYGNISGKAMLKGYYTKDRIKNIASLDSKCGKEISLSYEILNNYDEYCLALVKLHTGKSHQIRVQFSNMGHPLLGDRKYFNIESNRLNIKYKLKHQMLHAYRISFPNIIDSSLAYLSNKYFVANIPKEFYKLTGDIYGDLEK